MSAVRKRVGLHVVLVALSTCLSACPDRGPDETDPTVLVFDYRAMPMDRSGLPVGQPVSFTFDVYAPRLEGWLLDFDQVLRDSLQLVDLRAHNSVTPTVTFDPIGSRNDVRRVTITTPATAVGAWGLRIGSDRVRAAMRNTSGNYVFESCPGHDCFDEYSEHNEFFATVGKCPHLSSFKVASGAASTRTVTLQFSEPLSSLPRFRGRRVTRASGSSGCQAFDADFDLETTQDGSDRAKVKIDSEMRRCIQQMDLIVAETSDLSLAFNHNFSCQPGEFVVKVSVYDDGLPDSIREYPLVHLP